MSFQEEREKLMKHVEANTPKEALEAGETLIKNLKTEKFASKGIQVGETAPDFYLRSANVGDTVGNFSLRDATNRLVALHDLLAQGAVVINFYRGGWCPYCNLELRMLQRNIDKFNQLGAQLVAISPESPDNSLSTIEKHQLNFLVLSDVKSEVARQFGISYIVPEYLKKTFQKFGLDLSRYNDADQVELPIPATYVLDRDGVVRYAFASEDFTQRAEIADILQVLKTL